MKKITKKLTALALVIALAVPVMGISALAGSKSAGTTLQLPPPDGQVRWSSMAK